jgi:hypothetical protein
VEDPLRFVHEQRLAARDDARTHTHADADAHADAHAAASAEPLPALLEPFTASPIGPRARLTPSGGLAAIHRAAPRLPATAYVLALTAESRGSSNDRFSATGLRRA